jgi:hypothetical protein
MEKKDREREGLVGWDVKEEKRKGKERGLNFSMISFVKLHSIKQNHAIQIMMLKHLLLLN